MRKKEEEYTRELALKEQKRKELYAKQGRGSQFTSKGQRDEWIQKELKSLNKQTKDKTEQIERLDADLKKDAKKKVELETKIEEMGGEQDTYRTSIDDQNKGYYELKKKKDKLQVSGLFSIEIGGFEEKHYYIILVCYAIMFSSNPP
jgi:structural maintenance of chromosome 3 (chondroitin sulfate proteoglycan 6)